jgi:hypothetical protein
LPVGFKKGHGRRGFVVFTIGQTRGFGLGLAGFIYFIIFFLFDLVQLFSFSFFAFFLN